MGKTSATLTASQGMEMQTFISQASFAAGFCAGAGASAGGIGYSEELSPTLKASPSGNMMPSVLCLNDQGGRNMELSRDCVGTLRAQEHGHQPLIFDNHGPDCRYTGPMEVSPTICARAGEGGNNLPFAVEQNVAGTLCARDSKGADNICAEQNKLVVESPLLIRRLVPLECELLQGFPPGHTRRVGYRKVQGPGEFYRCPLRGVYPGPDSQIRRNGGTEWLRKIRKTLWPGWKKPTLNGSGSLKTAAPTPLGRTE